MNAFDVLAGWKLKAMLGGIVLASMVGVFAYFHHLGVQAQIKRDAPVIAGLQSDLFACRTNTASLDAAIKDQNAAIGAMKAESDARIAAISKQLSAAKKQTMKAEAAAAYVRAHPPKGPDLCSRVLDVDQTFLKALQ